MMGAIAPSTRDRGRIGSGRRLACETTSRGRPARVAGECAGDGRGTPRRTAVVKWPEVPAVDRSWRREIEDATVLVAISDETNPAAERPPTGNRVMLARAGD
jgi:hypothetical protein